MCKINLYNQQQWTIQQKFFLTQQHLPNWLKLTKVKCVQSWYEVFNLNHINSWQRILSKQFSYSKANVSLGKYARAIVDHRMKNMNKIIRQDIFTFISSFLYTLCWAIGGYYSRQNWSYMLPLNSFHSFSAKIHFNS